MVRLPTALPGVGLLVAALAAVALGAVALMGKKRFGRGKRDRRGWFAGDGGSGGGAGRTVCVVTP